MNEHRSLRCARARSTPPRVSHAAAAMAAAVAAAATVDNRDHTFFSCCLPEASGRCAFFIPQKRVRTIDVVSPALWRRRRLSPLVSTLFAHCLRVARARSCERPVAGCSCRLFSMRKSASLLACAHFRRFCIVAATPRAIEKKNGRCLLAATTAPFAM